MTGRLVSRVGEQRVLAVTSDRWTAAGRTGQEISYATINVRRTMSNGKQQPNTAQQQCVTKSALFPRDDVVNPTKIPPASRLFHEKLHR